MDFVNKKDKYTFNLSVLRNFHSSLEMLLDLDRVKFKVAQLEVRILTDRNSFYRKNIKKKTFFLF
jgi:hypothetical protein